jgi:hypothetical protein
MKFYRKSEYFLSGATTIDASDEYYSIYLEG